MNTRLRKAKLRQDLLLGKVVKPVQLVVGVVECVLSASLPISAGQKLV